MDCLEVVWNGWETLNRSEKFIRKIIKRVLEWKIA